MINVLNRRFGVEIEMLVPVRVSREALASALTAAGCPTQVMGYNHQRFTTWKTVSDASVRPEMGYYGIELVSPPMQGEEGFAQVVAAGNVLGPLGCKVNRSTGLHIHVDAATLTPDSMRRLAAVYADAEPVIDSLMPPSRRGDANTYCGSMRRLQRDVLARASDASSIAQAVNGGSRFCKLNFTAFWRHRTVEFRHHSGTVDGAKIVNWAKLCLRMVDFAANSTVSFATGVAMPVSVRAGTKRALLVELLMRPMGATRNELLRATGARTLSLGALSKAAGVTIVRGRRVNGGHTRYHATTAATRMTTSVVPENMTYESFCERLEFTSDEREFWDARRAFLANAINPFILTQSIHNV